MPWTASLMQKTFTHYEHLNVARDATPEQIKRAYRKLAQQLHPDRNPAPNASDLMSELNASHEVLRNPAKRILYDAQLAEDELRARALPAQAGSRQGAAMYAAAAQPSRAAASAKASAGRARPADAPAGKPVRERRKWRWAAVFVIFCAGGAWMGYEHKAAQSFVPTEALPVVDPRDTPASERADLTNAVLTPVITAPECVVPVADPLGAAWPVQAGYVKGLPMRKDNGWSQIVIDNSGGQSAVYAKVTDAVGRNAYRYAYIPAGGQFTFARMDAGYYLLKYQMLDTGCVFASSRILLEETPMGSQIKSSIYKLTLSKLHERGASPTRLKADQF